MTVTDRINAMLRERGIAKYRFYEECKISSGAFSMWKRGIVNPSRKSIESIAEYLRTTPEYLLTGEGEKEIPLPQEKGLTEDQIKVLRLFDSLSPSEQRALIATARGLIASRQETDSL